MTKWLITYCTNGKAWQVVGFAGDAGGESAGIVDLLAIRRNYSRAVNDVRPGDLFDIILIQIKGGNAPWPGMSDVARLRKTASHHRAKAVLLCEWKKGRQPAVYTLRRNRSKDEDRRSVWTFIDDPGIIFR